jgi:hypothetical protein
MSEKTNPIPPQVCCPFCGEQGESGHLVAYQALQWFQGEYGVWKDTFSGFGTKDLAGLVGLGGRVGTMSPAQHVYLTGIRCQACRRIMLDVPAGDFDDGSKKQASASERS